MTRAKDDWSHYNRSRKRELTTFIRESKRVIALIGSPGSEPPAATERGRGRPPYSPSAMLIVNLLRIYLKMSYRDLETLLQANGQLRNSIGLDSVPGRDTIHRYAKTLSEDYLQLFNDQLTARLKKTTSTPRAMPPVSRSRGTRSVGTLPTTAVATG